VKSALLNGYAQLTIKIMKNGPNEALLNLNESAKKQTITEYTKWELKRIKDVNFESPFEFTDELSAKIVAIEDEELKSTLMRLFQEQDNVRKQYLARTKLFRVLSGKTIEEIIRNMRQNTYKRRLTDISTSFVADNIQQVTTINPDGQMITFTFDRENGISATDNPSWLENFDLYKNKRPVTIGRNSNYHEDNRRDSDNRRRNNSGRFNGNGNGNGNQNRGGFRNTYRSGPYDRNQGDSNSRGNSPRSYDRDDRDNRY